MLGFRIAQTLPQMLDDFLGPKIPSAFRTSNYIVIEDLGIEGPTPRQFAVGVYPNYLETSPCVKSPI
jgi:hypothetical protein